MDVINILVGEKGERKPRKILKKFGKNFILANQGERFVIDVDGVDHERKLCVCSVDGLDVISGKPASLDSTGYVFTKHLLIEGWRTSDKEVKEFVFRGKKDSYASKTGNDTSNCGVIGVAVIGEVSQELADRIFLCASDAPQSKGLGTGMGESIESRVVDAEFERDIRKTTYSIIYYKTREELLDLGFTPDEIEDYPLAFPANNKIHNRFCKEV